jgi:hypothetical protein
MAKDEIIYGEDNQEKKFSDPVTDKRVQEILENESDHVTEEDIKNIRTDVDNTSAVVTEDMRSAEEIKEDKDEEKRLDNDIIKDDSDPEVDTSWNILGS